jgi:GGDEF domain-containing protein
MHVDGETIPVSISFGLSSIGDVGVNDPTSLLRKADEMLYSAKKHKQADSLETAE